MDDNVPTNVANEKQYFEPKETLKEWSKKNEKRKNKVPYFVVPLHAQKIKYEENNKKLWKKRETSLWLRSALLLTVPLARTHEQKANGILFLKMNSFLFSSFIWCCLCKIGEFHRCFYERLCTKCSFVI